jgi:hypothetical protein
VAREPQVRKAVDPAPLPAELPRQCKDEELRSLHLQAVVELPEVGLGDAGRGAGLRDLASEPLHRLRRHARRRRRRRRRIRGEPLAKEREHRNDRHLPFPGRNAVLPLQGGVESFQGERRLGSLSNASRGPVVDQKDVLFAPLFEVTPPQEAARIGPNEQREIRLLGDEARVVDPLLHHHVGEREAQRRVGGGLDRNPPISVDRRGVVIRGDRHDTRAAITRLVDEMGVRNLRIDRIAAPDQDQIGREEVVGRAAERDLAAGHRGARVVISEFGIQVQHGHVQESVRPLDADVRAAGAFIPKDRPRPVPLEHVETLVRDLAEGLFPGDPLPLPGPPFPDPLQGMTETAGIVHPLAETGSLLAAPRIEIRHLRVRLWIGRRLFLPPHDAVLHVHVPVAAPLVPAVHVVRALGDPIPGPLVPVEIAPPSVGCGGTALVRRLLEVLPALGASKLKQGEREDAGSAFEEAPP